jgi:hypothetical protein
MDVTSDGTNITTLRATVTLKKKMTGLAGHRLQSRGVKMLNTAQCPEELLD